MTDKLTLAEVQQLLAIKTWNESMLAASRLFDKETWVMKLAQKLGVTPELQHAHESNKREHDNIAWMISLFERELGFTLTPETVAVLERKAAMIAQARS